MNSHCEPFVADCQLRLATDLIAHAWDPVVLSALRAGPRRRRELLASIGGISDKVFSQALTRLLASGLIDRADDNARGVIYQLTDLGASLANGPLAALAQWAAENGNAVRTAQEHYSSRAAASGERLVASTARK